MNKLNTTTSDNKDQQRKSKIVDSRRGSEKKKIFPIIDEASSSRESSNIELTSNSRRGSSRLPRKQKRADSFRTDDSMRDYRGSVRHAKQFNGSEISGEDEFADFGPKVVSQNFKQHTNSNNRRLSNFRNEPIQESEEDSYDQEFDDEDDMTLSMTECQEEANEMLNDIIEDQEALLQKFNREHEELLSKSSSMASITSEGYAVPDVLDVYKILGLKKKQPEAK